MSNTVVAYVTEPDKTIVTHTFHMNNSNQQKELLALLHKIACGMEKGCRVTFSTEV